VNKGIYGVLGFVFVLHIAFSVVYTNEIINNSIEKCSNKILLLMYLWLLPFIGLILVRSELGIKASSTQGGSYMDGGGTSGSGGFSCEGGDD